jgi:AraC family transcriptional regulator
MPHFHVSTLFDGPLVSVTDVRCRAPVAPCGEEEYASAHQLIFTRAGVFVKHAGAGGRREVVAEPSRALFFNAGDRYRVSHPVPGGDECMELAFAPAAAAEVAAAFQPAASDRPDRPFDRTHALVPPAVLLDYHRLRRALRRAAVGGARVSELAAEEESLALLGAMLAAPGADATVTASSVGGRTGRAHQDLAEAVKEALAARPGDSHRLTALARLVGTSPFHLARVFRDRTGLPIHQYLLRLRLALALERLGDGVPSIGALAVDLGFASHSHFTAAFRRAFGVAPGQVRCALGAPRSRAYASSTSMPRLATQWPTRAPRAT